jgi:Galactose oxidase, central domain/Fibronectin type III domain
MLRATIQAGGHQSPHQRKHETARLPMVAGLVSLILTNLLACSGGGSSSSSHDPALASTCSSPTVSGSPLTNTLNSARANHTATLLSNGTVLVTGGSGNATPLTSAELYNPTTGQWAATDNLTVARASHTATLLPNGSVLVTGGSGSTGLLTSAELYNPTTGQWTATGNLTVARTGHTATLLPNGTVLVTGGSESAALLTSAELYNPTTGQWTATGDLTSARTGHTATLLSNGTVLVTGGSGSTGLLTSTELYNPATGQWTTTGDLTIARTGHTATPLLTPLPNGTVLVVGGHGSTGLLTSAELYNPTTGQWTVTGDLTVARTGHAATLLPTPLPNGMVSVAGGHGSTGPLTSAELYNPTTGQWTTTGDLTVARTSHTATLLPDGTVLAAGGRGSTGALTSAEIMTPSNGIQVRLTWNSATDPSVKGYKVYYGAAPNSYQQATDVGLSTNYSFSTLKSGTTYYFSVTAYNSVAEGCSSSEVSRTIL